MRTFISIEIPKEVKDELWRLQNNFRDLAKVKWVAKKHYHICLKFLGDVSESKLEKVKVALKKVKFDSFKVSLNKLGVFPNESRINVVWVDSAPTKDIMSLQSDVEDSLKGLVERSRKFAVHITIGRVKSIKSKDEFIKKIKSLSPNKINFKIENFYLMTSKLTKDGPKYKVLEKY